MAWRLRADVVEENLRRLKNQKIHRVFAGYLCLKRTAARDGRTSDLEPRFREFFDTFLQIPDAPDDRPYFVPFSDTATSDANRWFNRNVAGSYAPSSLRPVSPLRRVVSIEGRRYSLVDEHWERAREHITLGSRVPSISLSTFLYRNFAFLRDEPTAEDVLTVFREEFGYATASFETAEEEYSHLYYEDEDTGMSYDWFEAV